MPRKKQLDRKSEVKQFENHDHHEKFYKDSYFYSLCKKVGERKNRPCLRCGKIIYTQMGKRICGDCSGKLTAGAHAQIS